MDRVYIWVDGSGLSATGYIREIKEIDYRITFTLDNVSLIEKPRVTFEGPGSQRYLARGNAKIKAYGFLLDVPRNRHNRTQELSDRDFDDIRSVMKLLGATSNTIQSRNTAVQNSPAKKAFSQPSLPPIDSPPTTRNRRAGKLRNPLTVSFNICPQTCN